MNDFNARIDKLRKAILKLSPPITVYYADGAARSMKAESAITEAVNSAISGAVKVTGGGNSDGFLIDIIQAVIETE